MNFTYKYFTLISFVLGVSFSVTAQQELGVHFMDDVWQSTQTNPAFVSERKVVIGLPSVYGNLYHSGFSLNDAIVESGDSRMVNFDGVISGLDKTNILQTNLNIDVLSIGLRFGDLQLGASVGARASAFANYSAQTLDLLWNGNANYIGETVNLAPDFQVMTYGEFALSGAYRLNDIFTVGTKLKYLRGFSDVSAVEGSNLSVTTSNDVYQTNITTDFSLQQAGFGTADDLAGLMDNGVLLPGMLTGAGSGFGLDLGLRAQVTDKLVVSASVVDLGRINWATGVSEYTTNGSYSWEGLDLFAYVSGDTLEQERLSTDFEQVLDTLGQIFDIERNTAVTNYRTSLASKVYLSGTYDVLESLRVGALLYLENYRGATTPSVALSARKKFGRWLSLGGVYAVRNKRFDNLGLNAALNLGPAQLYLTTDNVIPLFRPFDSQNINFRLGFNLGFGK